jgi:hypothetical protein
MLAAMPTPLPRRAVLRVAGTGVSAGLVMALAGCTEEASPPPPDPDRSALEDALAVEEQLRDVAAGLPPDGRDAFAADAVDVVDAHLEVLRSALGDPMPSPSGSPSPSTAPPVDRAALLAATDAAVDSHTSALRQASPAVSPLIASLAASDAALAALVRGAR